MRQSESAFAALIERHAGLVYGSALPLTTLDPGWEARLLCTGAFANT
jgi:hypothetical protein